MSDEPECPVCGGCGIAALSEHPRAADEPTACVVCGGSGVLRTSTEDVAMTCAGFMHAMELGFRSEEARVTESARTVTPELRRRVAVARLREVLGNSRRLRLTPGQVRSIVEGTWRRGRIGG
jgi:hypothetical protein